ncbi:hypothetical protein ALI22I_31170 [Saccharothrix sp. ALI-22-I]|uniref:glycosyltransferase n=1 Tax=Saccharothrix sp. ALI-22-I TaxID=1933778 RepID=UPI00097BAB6E|nr:glycosyltransferase [Saccharothrix sp. ALI-22-I]ONI84928.1 hypothetical protein ALI22I_31170 [Saccharothrix sp. ALI-22-I]
MKIAAVSAHASPLPVLSEAEEGGQDVHVADLAAALVASGHDVVVHTRRDSVRIPDVVRTRHGYDVVHVPAGPPTPVRPNELLPHLDEFTRFLRGQWRAEPPDVVHAHYWTSGVASVLAANGLDVPVVQTFHSLGVVEQAGGEDVPETRLSTERLIGREASRVVAGCTDEKAQLVRLGVPRTRIAVVPAGVDVQRFKPDGPRLNRPLPHRLVTPAAGAEDVITALRSVWDTELVVVGDRPGDVRRLREHARAQEVGDRVRLVGRVPRVAMPALLRSADVVVCAAPDESGVVPLEAMACGVPVVAATVGASTDTVVDGVTGLLVPPNDPRTLARVLRPLLADDARRDAYGIAGTDRVEARYSTVRIAAETIRVYRQATGQPETMEASAQDA